MAEGNGPQAAHQVRLLARRLDGLLPQLQCAKCGHPGCKPYARALAAGTDRPDRCVPGGADTARALAAELGVDQQERDRWDSLPAQVAVIDEGQCVGCFKCIEACPVDAIIGAHGLMHTVFTEWCTGCGLCIEPCPVDCITLRDAGSARGDGQLVQHGVAGDPVATAAAARLRARHEAKAQRPPLRAAHGTPAADPAELARQAMNRAARRHDKPTPMARQDA